MIELQRIERKTGPAPGGSTRLFLALWEDVQFIPPMNPVNKKIVDNIIFKPGKSFHEFIFAPGKCRLSNPSSGQDGSSYFETMLDATIEGDDAERLYLFEQMINGRFIAVVDQASRQIKLAGSAISPLLCRQVNNDAGGEISEASATVFQFKSRGLMAREYAGNIQLIPAEDNSTEWLATEPYAFCLKESVPGYVITPTTPNQILSASQGTFENPDNYGLVADASFISFQEENAIAFSGKSLKVNFISSANKSSWTWLRTDVPGGNKEQSLYAGTPVFIQTKFKLYIPSAMPGLKDDGRIHIQFGHYSSSGSLPSIHNPITYIGEYPKDQWIDISQILYQQGIFDPATMTPQFLIQFYPGATQQFNQGGAIYIDNLTMTEVLIKSNGRQKTGMKGYSYLSEFFVATGFPTGATKENLPADPDYVAPVIDLNTCPIP